MTTVWLARHAPVRLRGHCYGWADVAPAWTAPRTAEVIARALPQSPDQIWASDLSRTASVAEALARRLDRPWRVDARLRELSFGRWEHRSWEAIHASEEAALAFWADDPVRRAPPGGETADQLMERFVAWFGELCPGVHLAVTHAGIVRAAWVHSRQASWAEALGRAVPHASVHAVTRTEGRPRPRGR